MKAKDQKISVDGRLLLLDFADISKKVKSKKKKNKEDPNDSSEPENEEDEDEKEDKESDIKPERKGNFSNCSLAGQPIFSSAVFGEKNGGIAVALCLRWCWRCSCAKTATFCPTSAISEHIYLKLKIYVHYYKWTVYKQGR